jgi:hypothetical protein
MAGRQIYDPNGFKNTVVDGKVVGFQFDLKHQYYRGFTLSILRRIEPEIDGEMIPREDVRLVINGETFTLEECRTTIDSDFRWEFSDYATVICLKDGGLEKGKHHLKVKQVVAPSYMPFELEHVSEIDFEI